MSSLKTTINGEQVQAKRSKISDVQKTWKKIASHKFLFLGSIALFLALAFLQIKYTTPVYLITSTISVKEEDNSRSNPSSLLLTPEGTGMVSEGPDKAMEIAILTSYPFIYKTLSSLDMNVSYFAEGKIGNHEIYGRLPFKVTFTDSSTVPKIYFRRFGVKFNNPNQISLTNLEKDDKAAQKITVGQEVSIDGCKLKIVKTPQFDAQADVGKNYEFLVQDLKSLAFEFQNNISISSDEKSSLLEIELKTPVPEKGVEFLNEYLTQYLKDKYEEKSRAASGALAFINDQINTVKSSLGNTESSMASFKANNTFTDAASMTDRNLNALAEIENERATLSLQDRYYSNILSGLNSNDLDQLVTPSSVGVQDALTDNLVKELTELQIEKSSYAASGNLKNPLVQNIDVRINNVKNTLKENIRSLSNANRLKLNQLSSRAGQYQAKVYSIPIAEKAFTDMKRSSSFNDELYQFLMQKRVEAGILKASATVDNKIIEPALADSALLLSPKKGNTYALAILLGFFLPFGYIKLKDALNKKVTGKEEIIDNTSIPVLGSIYRNPEHNPLVISSGSRTAVSESFRLLRSNINYYKREASKKVIMISSLDSGEGKSFISTNIAISFAIAKKRTVLINLDLRVPSVIYNEIGHNDIGISSYLNDDATIKDIVQVTENPYFHFISTGELPSNPSELLMDPKLESLIMHLRSSYDQVIIDTPPLGVVADPFIISKFADLNIVVVREKYSLKERLFELDEIYKEGKMRDVALVVNDVKLTKKGYKNAYYK